MSTEIKKSIYWHINDKYMVIIPTVNITEEFQVKWNNISTAELIPLMDNKSIQLCINQNVFNEFLKSVGDEVNVIITINNTASKFIKV